MKNSSYLPIIFLPLLLAGCVASLDGGSESEPGVPGTNPPKGGNFGSELPDLEALNCDELPVDPGSSPMRLLSREQYLNTLEALVGHVPEAEAALANFVDASSLGASQAHVNANDVEGYERAAAIVANYVTTDPDRLSRIAPCAEDADPSDCARTFVVSFGSEAYRAPVDDADDISDHLALFSVGLSESYAHGIELVLKGMLQSPRFLYQVEVGTSDHVAEGAVRLTPHEVAARLSYAVWNGKPDERLLAAAKSGELASEEGVQAQLEWMLKDDRGRRYVQQFLEDWTHIRRVLSLAKREDIYPAWQEVQSATYEQGAAFFDQIVEREGGKLSALLTSKSVMVSDKLAAHYGVSAGAEFEAIELAGGNTSGLLTLPALLATLSKPGESSPVHRGLFVRESLLCQHPPAPPSEIPAAPEVDSGGSTRERLAQHLVDPGCANCHQLLDPVGFGLENYDSIGMYRESDGGKAVDASGELTGTDVNGAFTGPVQLGEMLAQSEIVEQCVARQWFRYAIKRVETDSDLCAIKSIVEDFRDADQDLRTLPQAVVKTDAFLYRRPSDAQVTP